MVRTWKLYYKIKPSNAVQKAIVVERITRKVQENCVK